MMIRSTFLFSNWNRKSKTDHIVIISSLTVTLETKTASDSLCPIILILPYPTLLLTDTFECKNILFTL